MINTIDPMIPVSPQELDTFIASIKAEDTRLVDDEATEDAITAAIMSLPPEVVRAPRTHFLNAALRIHANKAAWEKRVALKAIRDEKEKAEKQKAGLKVVENGADVGQPLQNA